MHVHVCIRAKMHLPINILVSQFTRHSIHKTILHTPVEQGMQYLLTVIHNFVEINNVLYRIINTNNPSLFRNSVVTELVI